MKRKHLILLIGLFIILIAYIVFILLLNRRIDTEIESIDSVIAQYASEESTDDRTTEVEIEETTEMDSSTTAVTTVSTSITSEVTTEEISTEMVTEEWISYEQESSVDWIEAEIEETYDIEYYPSGDMLTPDAGVVWFDGHMETYYNLDMSGVLDIMYALGYSGDYWVRSDGCKMFGDYIMCAADFNWLPRGSVVLTSLGWAIVCDTGAGGWNWLDIAVTW